MQLHPPRDPETLAKVVATFVVVFLGLSFFGGLFLRCVCHR